MARQCGMKFRIYPNKEQREQLAIFFDAARFVWNFFLAKKQEERKLYKKFSEAEKEAFHWLTCFDMIKMLKPLKREEKTQWLQQAPTHVLQRVPAHLIDAYNRFFKGLAEPPKFKSKKRAHNSITDDKIRIIGDKLFVPKMDSLVSMKQDRGIPAGARISSATVSCEGNPKWSGARYYVSFKVTLPDETECFEKTGKSIGIDVGLETFCTLSNGKKVARHRFEKKARRRLAHLQRIQSRKQEGARKRYEKKLVADCVAAGKPVPENLRKLSKKIPSEYYSKRFERIKNRVAAAHSKVSNQRHDFLHKLSLQLVKEYDFIAAEDLRVRNMLKNPNLARSMSDAAWSEFFRMLAYKCEWFGKIFVKVPPAYTSQTCSVCGCRKKLELKDRDWTCPDCGTHHDRDVNAAKNILAKGLDLLNVPGGIKKKQAKRIGSLFGRRKKQGNDVSVASARDADYTSGGTAEVGPSGERGIIQQRT